MVCVNFYFARETKYAFIYSGGDYIQYDMEVSCPSCRTVADIKLSQSHDNPGRTFYKCGDCGKFLKWARPLERRRRMLDEEK